MRYFSIIRLRFEQVTVILRFCIAFFYTTFCRKNTLWLISERGKEARDNAFIFFKWLKKNHPEINVKYVISSDSQDLKKLKDYSNDIIFYGTWSHYLTLCKASHLISTHIMGYTPNISLFVELDRRFNLFRNKKRIFLQHGVIVNSLPFLYAENVRLDLFVSGSFMEYNFLNEKFHYPSGIIQYLGLCRYDNLVHFSPKQQLLIMPTWRNYIDKSQFIHSEYFKHFSSLLCSEFLHKISRIYNFRVIFYPHFELQDCISHFKDLELPDNIVIADFNYDVQTLLKESQLLITDYSSVFFDVAFMHKPIIFYQFDRQQFYSQHYKTGYFNDLNIGFVTYTEEDLLSTLYNVYQDNCKLKDNIVKEVDKMFPYRDSNNCKRTYNAIQNL